jgi:energy-coupling factor transport system permease protein
VILHDHGVLGGAGGAVSLLAPLAPDPDAALARFNPVAKISAAVVVMVGLLATLDPLTPALLLAAELAVVPWTGVSVRGLARRCWPLLLGAAGVALTNLLVVDGGRVLLDLGPVDVTSQAVESAVGVSLRLLAIALPGILVLATTDPMDLADALVQRWRAPARFAYGALAALRLLPLLSADWQQVSRARRARGLDPGRSPAGVLRAFAAQVLAVLVAAVRRGVRLATAMEARGFGAGGVQRTVARPQPLLARDWWLLALTTLVVAAATAAAVAVGSWRLPFA